MDDSSDVSNYRPIPVLPCFSIISKCIMHNRLCKYLIENKILYSKQFGFWNGHSTDNAIVQFVDQIWEPFDRIKYTLGALLTFQRLDTVDHFVLIWHDGQKKPSRQTINGKVFWIQYRVKLLHNI